jgi:branched-chain amino acid transport system substrate-binding protein
LRRHLLLFCFLFIWLTACTAPNTPPTFKIGLVAPFEGLHRPLGYEVLFAVKLALQERNAAGGIGGYQVELVALNDFDDPAEAAIQAQALAADPDVMGVVGHLSSATTLAALPVYQQAQLAVSIPWSVAPAEGADRPGVVNVAATEKETAAYLQTFIQTQGLTPVIELTDNYPVPISDEIRAVLFNTDGVSAGEAATALRQINSTRPLLGQTEAGSPQLVQVAGAAANGLVFVSPGPNPALITGGEAFTHAYQALAGFPPGPRALLAYDAAQVLLDGIEQSLRINQHQPSRAQVSAGINSVQRQGLSGVITFNRQGSRINAPLWLYQIADQTYPGVLLTP